jgi:small-conductance mechanosensitive channel
MVTVQELLASVPNRLFLAAGLVIIGTVLGLAAGRVNRRLLRRVGVPEAVEGTAFERTMRGFGTSTVSIIASLSTWFIIGVSVLAAVSVAEISYLQVLSTQVTSLLPQLFVALIVLIVGIVVGDKVELLVSERLKGIKLPEVTVLPQLAKYSVIYVAILIALGQVGVVTGALVVLLGAYAFAVVILGSLAFKDLLASGAAGICLLLNQPYGIGDEVRIGEESGIVQEIDVFVTRIEDDSAEHVVPNSKVFEHGVVRRRQD